MTVRIQALGTAPRPSTARTLSKSDFKLARTCEAKLYFRENGYTDNRDGDPYLALLAEGGYMVEALAKARYPDGVQLDYGRDPAQDYARTLEHLSRDNVTLFEATLIAGRRQARVDILEKKGNVVRLLEVKAKSFDGAEHTSSLDGGRRGALRAVRAPHRILADWEEKLEDITFQVLLLEKMMPDLVIRPFLVLVDKCKHAGVDDVPSYFELVRHERDGAARLHTARYIGPPELLGELDLITEVDVSEEVAMLRHDVEGAAALFESRLDAPLPVHLAGVERGAKCRDCEFRVDADADKNGFAECWRGLATPSPHMLELFSVSRARAPDNTPLIEWMIGEGKAALLDIPLDGLEIRNANPASVPARQRRQIEFTRRGEIFRSDALSDSIDALKPPLYFIDFETSRLALPYHRGMKPYGLVTFQWSCHTVDAIGACPAHSHWLNDADVWPNQAFAESLRSAIGDDGAVVTWTHFEATTMRQIIADLDRFGRKAPELVEWITDVIERRIVDLHEWARSDYYHPGMGGRTSIKAVMHALWSSDPIMHQQFEEWTGLKPDVTRDPYSALPPVEINGVLQDVHEGTAAVRAYQEMMYGADKHDSAVRAQWGSLLRQYCALDTLSMVLILEHWRRVVGSA